MLVVADGVLMPWLVRRANAREATARATAPPPLTAPVITEQQRTEDPTRTMHTRITDALEWLNVNVGVFVAYWCLISVFAYYYEVVARFVFNSPTNWVHESMFLMFGMMYMLSGAYAYRERSARQGRRALFAIFGARQSDLRHHHLGLLLHLHADDVVDRLALRR